MYFLAGRFAAPRFGLENPTGIEVVDGRLLVLFFQVERFVAVVDDDYGIVVIPVIVPLPSSDYPGGLETVLDHLFQPFHTVAVLSVPVADGVTAGNGLAIGDCDGEPFRVLGCYFK